MLRDTTPGVGARAQATERRPGSPRSMLSFADIVDVWNPGPARPIGVPIRV
jgi:hypothetical protein